MKRIFSIAICAMIMAVCSSAAQARDDDGKKQRMSREQMAEVQAKNIAHALALDDATGQKFVEVFSAYRKEVWALGPLVKKDNTKDLTEAEAEQRIKKQFEHSQQILSIREKYYKKYSEFLTQKQIQRVYELEKNGMKRIAKRSKAMKERQKAKGRQKGLKGQNAQQRKGIQKKN